MSFLANVDLSETLEVFILALECMHAVFCR